MNSRRLQYHDFREGDTWLAFRLDAQVQEKSVDVYMIMDLPNGKLIATQVIDTDYLQERHAKALLDGAHAKVNRWPKVIILIKSDPAEAFLQKVAATHDINLKSVPSPQLEDILDPVKRSYGQRMFSPSTMAYAAMSDDVDEMDRQTAKQMVPDAYDPCWCGSDKKFKFCCKPIFREVVGAMAASQDGQLEEALRYINDAKRTVGETAEVLCRESIVWSRFDLEKSDALLKRALADNPNHPRANYIVGINLKNSGDFIGAIAAYKRAIENYPKTDRYHLNETYNNLGTAHYESGDPMSAKLAWEQAFLLLPSDKTTRLNLMEFIYENSQLSASERSPNPLVKKHLQQKR
jgi:hypothetical protein